MGLGMEELGGCPGLRMEWGGGGGGRGLQKGPLAEGPQEILPKPWGGYTKGKAGVWALSPPV